MFLSFKAFRGSGDKIEPTLESKQGLEHVKKANN
jgi:hypothetical protein